MAAPAMFLSIIAIVMVSVTSLVIVQNRSRIKTIASQLEENRSGDSRAQLENNYKFDSIVKEVNLNTNTLNDKLFEIDTALSGMDQRLDVEMSNVDLRIQAGDHVQSINYMAMSNEVSKSMRSMNENLMATEARSRSNLTRINSSKRAITQNSNAINTLNTTLNERITSEVSGLQTRASVFSNAISPRVKSLEESEAELRNWRTTHQSDYDEQLSFVKQGVQDNTDLILRLQTDSLDLSEEHTAALRAAIEAQSTQYQSTINSFFGGNGVFGSKAHPSYDSYMRDRFFSGAHRNFKSMQEMVDAVDMHHGDIRTLNSAQEAVNENIVSMDTAMHSFNTLRSNEIDALDLRMKENAKNLSDYQAQVESTFAKKDDHRVTQTTVDEHGERITLMSNNIELLETEATTRLPARIKTVDDKVNSNYDMIGNLEMRMAELEGIGDVDGYESGTLAHTAYNIIMTQGEPRMRALASEEAAKHMQANLDTEVSAMIDRRMSSAGEGGGVVTATNFPTHADTYMTAAGIGKDAEGAIKLTKNLVSRESVTADNLEAKEDVVSAGGTNSLNAMADELVETRDMMYENHARLHSFFDISDGMVSADPESKSYIDMVRDISCRHNLEMAEGKNLTLKSKDYEGGELRVPNFDKIKYTGPSGEVTLQQALTSASMGGLDAESLATMISGARIPTIMTGGVNDGDCPDAGNKKCSSVNARLETLESRADAMQSTLDLTLLENTFNPDDLYATQVHFNSGSHSMLFDNTGLAITGALNVNNNINVGQNARVGESLSVAGTAKVVGAATFDDNVDVAGNAVVAGSLHIGAYDVMSEIGRVDGRVTAMQTNMDTADAFVTSVTRTPTGFEVTTVDPTATIGSADRVTSEQLSVVAPAGATLRSSTVGGLNHFRADVLQFRDQDDDSGATDVTTKVPHHPVVKAQRVGDELQFTHFDPSVAGGYVESINISPTAVVNELESQGIIQMTDTDPPKMQSLIIGSTAIQAGPNAGELQVCKYANGSVSDCTLLWDHRQAPRPEVGSSGGSVVSS